jgi:hypothetical protein
MPNQEGTRRLQWLINEGGTTTVMMRRLTNTGLFALILLGGSPLSAEVNIGINIGPPPPPRVVYVHPARPGPEFMWIEGYWYPKKGHYHWHEGYWAQRPYEGSLWVAPRYDGHRYFVGYWQHPHGWDKKHHKKGHGHGHGKKKH